MSKAIDEALRVIDECLAEQAAKVPVHDLTDKQVRDLLNASASR